jgi:hypothetical protein
MLQSLDYSRVMSFLGGAITYCEFCSFLDLTEVIFVGVDSGDTIHVREAGNSGGHGALPGSLYIKLRVRILSCTCFFILYTYLFVL